MTRAIGANQPVQPTQATGQNQPNTPADRFLAAAMKFQGQPYLWGGGHVARTFTEVGRVDCSGLVMQAARMAGVQNLDGTAALQQRMGQPVSMSDLKPGDLVFKGNPAYHVGIYIGNGQVLHAPKTGDVVRVTTVSGWQSARRIFNEAGQPVPNSAIQNAPAAATGGGSGGGTGGGGGASSGGGGGGSVGSSSGGGSGSPSGLNLPKANIDNMTLDMARRQQERSQAQAATGRGATPPMTAGELNAISSGMPPGNLQIPAEFSPLMRQLGQYGLDAAAIQGLAQKYGVPVPLILATIQQGSGGNPKTHSPDGRQGLMQLGPEALDRMGVTEPLDPKQNVEAGVRYMALQLKASGGDVAKAVASYQNPPVEAGREQGQEPHGSGVDEDEASKARKAEFTQRVVARYEAILAAR